MTVAFGIGAMAFVTFVDVLLYYLMTTSPGATNVAGVQVRHFFPIAIAAAVLAAPVLRRPEAAPAGAMWTAAGGLFAGLLLVRAILLAQDLLLRYW